MSNHITAVARREQLVTTLTEHIATLTRRLSDWVLHETPTLERMEQHLLAPINDVAATLLAGLAQLLVPGDPLPAIPCACGATAHDQRQRSATVKTVVGPVTLTRP